MEHTLDDLRSTLAEAGTHAPANPARSAQVRRRLRRGNRTRLLAFGAVALAAVAAGTVPLTRDDAPAPAAYDLLAADPSPLPDTLWGMPRIGVRTFPSTGVRVRVRFTPTGGDTAVVVRCSGGASMVQWVNGHINASGGCAPHRGLPGAVSQWTRATDGALKAGVPFTLDAAIVKGRPQSEIDLLEVDEVERLVEGQTAARSDWWIAVYSGTCQGEPGDCPGS